MVSRGAAANGWRSDPIIRLDARSIRDASREIAARDLALSSVLGTWGPPPTWRRPANFATFVRIILEQQVSLGSAKATLDRLTRLLHGRSITAMAVAGLRESELRTIGFSRQKARYTIALANQVKSRQFGIAALRDLDDETATRRITDQIGLGPWSAAVYLMMALMRPDILPRGDLALAKGLAELDGGDYRDFESLDRRTRSWRPFRSVGVRLVWQSYLARRNRTMLDD
ncbi:MAG: DNA-3-methyladenine glycosylase 2 family protein [Planctomycetota bacterium]